MLCCICFCSFMFFFSSRRRHTRCALVTGVQTCALPISAFRLGRLVRPILPDVLRNKIPQARPAGAVPSGATHERNVLILAGCVQPAMMPSIDAATIRVLDSLGIEIGRAHV